MSTPSCVSLDFTSKCDMILRTQISSKFPQIWYIWLSQAISPLYPRSPPPHHNFAMSRVQQAQDVPCAVGDLSLGAMGHPLKQRNNKVQQRGGAMNEQEPPNKQIQTPIHHQIIWFYINKLGNSIHSIHQIGEQQIQQYLCFFHLTCQGFLPTVPLHISTAEGPPSPVFHSFI